jgi:hypothetical protein
VVVIFACVRIVNNRDRVNAEQKPARQLHDGCRPYRWCIGEELGEERIERRERSGISDEARDLDHPREAASRVLEHSGKVRERLTRLRLEGVAGDGAG